MAYRVELTHRGQKNILPEKHCYWEFANKQLLRKLEDNPELRGRVIQTFDYTAVCQKIVFFDEILEEDEVDIIFVKDEQIFKGALFFEIQEWEQVKEVLKEEEFGADTEEELALQCINFYIENADKHYDSTEKTMRHWQFINGFTAHIFPIWE